MFSAYRKWSADVREVILVVFRSLEFKPEPMCEYNGLNSFILFFIGTSLGQQVSRPQYFVALFFIVDLKFVTLTTP